MASSSSRPSTSNAAPSNIVTVQGSTFTSSTVHVHQHVNQSMSGEPPQSYGLPSLPTIVDKREADIRELHALISEHHKVVITGIGGFGKTTLANLCTRKWVEDGTYQHVIFVNVETDESASGVFKRLAEIILNSQVCSEFTIKEIYARYNKAKTLLILDNIVQSSILPRYYPSDDLKNIDILGTSQFTELRRLFHLYPLQELSEEASVQLILDIFSSAEIEVPATIVPMITDLVVKLEFHPLALQHIAALIIDMCTYDDMSLEQSLNKYTQHFEAKLKKVFPTDHLSEYRKSVYAAISLNIEKATIGKEHVKSLLHCMTYLDPSGINFKVLYKAFSTDQFKESLKQLKRYSLISVDEDMVSMHRLVPQVCHAMLTADDKITYLNRLFNIFFYNTDNHWLSPIRRHCSFFIWHFNFDIKKEEFAAYYKAAFYNNDQIKERLAARLQMIDSVISDTEGWSVQQCCVFAGHETFYRHFNDTGNTTRVGMSEIGFVQVIRNSILDLFDDFKQSILEFYKHKKEELNKPIFKNLTMLSICAAYDIYGDDFNKLIDMGCDVNITDNSGMTPILWAARNMCYENVFTLLHRGATCDVIYKEVLTAAAAGDGESVLRLLRTSEVSYATGEYGKMLLWWAADKGHHDIVRELIECGTDTSGADTRGNTLLHMVARGGYDETVSQFILADGNVNIINMYGNTALIVASDSGHDKIVSELIGAEADLNIADSDGNTALIVAADSGHDKIVSVLIAAKANVNIANSDGNTALILAAGKGHDKIAIQLVQAGANVNLANYVSGTPLHCAARSGHREVVTELVNLGAHVDTADKRGITPLLAATEHKHREISMYLIEKGASVNVVDRWLGDTPLLFAAEHRDYELALELINRGARTDTANNRGETPLSWAQRNKDDIMQQIISSKRRRLN